MAFSLSGKPWGDLRKFDVVNWSFEEQDVALSIIGRSAVGLPPELLVVRSQLVLRVVIT